MYIIFLDIGSLQHFFWCDWEFATWFLYPALSIKMLETFFSFAFSEHSYIERLFAMKDNGFLCFDIADSFLLRLAALMFRFKLIWTKQAWTILSILHLKGLESMIGISIAPLMGNFCKMRSYYHPIHFAGIQQSGCSTG